MQCNVDRCCRQGLNGGMTGCTTVVPSSVAPTAHAKAPAAGPCMVKPGASSRAKEEHTMPNATQPLDELVERAEALIPKLAEMLSECRAYIDGVNAERKENDGSDD